MAEISQSTIQAYVESGSNGSTTADQGRALEDMVCYIFEQVPGISITRRNELNSFHTEEIDIALWNDTHANGFHFLPNGLDRSCAATIYPVLDKPRTTGALQDRRKIGAPLKLPSSFV